MNYASIYDRIISVAKVRTLLSDVYIEKHHIVPRSIGGPDSTENIVRLTAKEHYVCHKLLTKMYAKGTPEYFKMVKAFMMMCSHSANHKRYTGVIHEKLRKEFALAQSYSQSGRKNSNYGTKWIHSVVLRKSIKIPKEENVPAGWCKGRVVDFDNYYNRTCSVCSKKFRSSTNKTVCSKHCKKKLTRPDYCNLIDRNFETLVSIFEDTNSISKTLSTIGLNAKTREGNRYFSEKLKEHGYSVLRRRNSSV